MTKEDLDLHLYLTLLAKIC